MSISHILTQRLDSLRKLFAVHGIDAYIIPHCDAHQSEYIAACDERVACISGFDGSAGTCVVTMKAALLWTDGRYFNQAQKQLNSEWTLMKDRVPGTPKISDWLATQNLKAVGFDPRLMSIGSQKDLSAKVPLVPVNDNLVDAVWTIKPPQSAGPIREQLEVHAGESVESKLDRLRREMSKEGADNVIISALDEVAWLFNLRGSDIPYNPVFFSYAVITQADASLFVNPSSLTTDAVAAMKAAHVRTLAYTEFFNYLEKLHGSFWFDADSTSAATLSALGSAVRVEKTLPIQLWKACKNDAEVDGSRAAHVRDGLAKTKWLHWLQREIEQGREHTEVTVSDELERFRKKGKDFRGLSFPSISGSGPNAAVIHYHAHEGSCSRVDPQKIYLIDSGAQYSDGTTDVTRTVHFAARPSDREMEAFTRVLKGVISISRAVFPEGTTGPALDALGRQHLWSAGMDFRHGIGHGVGSFLCVHEGPQGICQAIFNGGRGTAIKTALKKGMLLSNEPGYYEDGQFGIRIENVMVVKETDINDVMNPGKKMLGFETLTQIPIQKKMIKKDLLSQDEIAWLNEYHSKIYSLHYSHLSPEEKAWLQSETSPI